MLILDSLPHRLVTVKVTRMQLKPGFVSVHGAEPSSPQRKLLKSLSCLFRTMDRDTNVQHNCLLRNWIFSHFCYTFTVLFVWTAFFLEKNMTSFVPTKPLSNFMKKIMFWMAVCYWACEGFYWKTSNVHVSWNKKNNKRENPQVKQESFPEPFLVLQDVLTQQDNPSCSCRRPAEWGGQLPWVCLFPSLPPCYILSRQAACIVELLFSCQTETFTHCNTTSQSFVFTALSSPGKSDKCQRKKK